MSTGSSARVPRFVTELRHQEASGFGAGCGCGSGGIGEDDGSYFVEDGEAVVPHETRAAGGCDRAAPGPLPTPTATVSAGASASPPQGSPRAGRQTGSRACERPSLRGEGAQ